MSTVGELIEEKKDNFTTFLIEVLENEEVIKHITEAEITTFKASIDKLKEASIVIFIFFITKELMPKKDELDSYLKEFLIMNGIDKDSFFLDDEKLKEYPPILTEYKEKVKKYLKLFIDIMEYSFE